MKAKTGTKRSILRFSANLVRSWPTFLGRIDSTAISMSRRFLWGKKFQLKLSVHLFQLWANKNFFGQEVSPMLSKQHSTHPE